MQNSSDTGPTRRIRNVRDITELEPNDGEPKNQNKLRGTKKFTDDFIKA